MDGKWIKPLYNARKLAKLRNEYIAKGYYWPQKPMADRGLDRTPKGHKRVMLQEERYGIMSTVSPVLFLVHEAS